MSANTEYQQETSSSVKTNNADNDQQRPQQPDSMVLMDGTDEEQLKRLLACKRLSEGCNRFVNGSNLICRKNSLHMMGESLAPVTEGEPMRHVAHHMSQNIESTSSSSVSSGSFRSGSRHLGNANMIKRNSQDDNATSCSSSTSLDGAQRSPSRRRSSTVSQCSSVLSEGTRQQLNFDLSQDLPPDSSILEANAISPIDSERPASPEPSSLDSADGSFDMRPISRMSQFCDEIMMTESPDSTLGDSNETSNPEVSVGHDDERPPISDVAGKLVASANSETVKQRAADCERYEASIRDNLDRIISHVSTVKVSCNGQMDDQNNNCPGQPSQINGQKRAHTPFGANTQRNKTSYISSTPSPTSQETVARG